MSQHTSMHEKRFHNACEAIQDDLLDAAHSLHTLQASCSQSVQVLAAQTIRVSRIMMLAENMATKSPRCPTVLMSPRGYFQREFQQVLRKKILRILNKAVIILNTGDKNDCQVRYAAANQVETALEELEFAPNSRE
ncbi:uncharacterized protein N7529_004780 [Penicillium soppii]|uniref:uncharacterized protein n=1 Tax=Penicillium soppii TaxID=69789 RepID=UPI002547604D|nr:uncharacterized protein N7529_004780 [Penicillium soppii]KAJ5872427.1 hypothetical protein N7529_004780 [Penicillium soppii]